MLARNVVNQTDDKHYARKLYSKAQALSNYFPETVAADLARYPSIPYLVDQMRAAGIMPLEPLQVELSYLAHDINIYEARAFSCLHLISDEAFRHGLKRLRADLARGPIQCRTRYVILPGRNRRETRR